MKNKQSYEVAYICNGKNPKCKGHPGCYYVMTSGRRGACNHTLDIRYAINKKLDPKTNPERFDKFKCGDQVRYYEKFE